MNKTEFTYCTTCGYPMTSENNEVGSSIMKCRHCDLFEKWKKQSGDIKELQDRAVERVAAHTAKVAELTKDNARLRVCIEEMVQEANFLKSAMNSQSLETLDYMRIKK